MEKQPFLVIALPVEKDKAALATQLVKELTAACGDAPTMVRPDATALCMLVFGEFKRITRAVNAAIPYDARSLVVQVGPDYEALGLSTAAGWLQRHI